MDFTMTTERLIDLMQRFEDDANEIRPSKIGRFDATRSESAKQRDRFRRVRREAKAFGF